MRIIFEFAGGPMDGKTVVGRLGEQDEADRFYALTHHGRVGQHFRVASSFAIEMLADEALKAERPRHFQQHYYRVTDRLDGEEEVLVRVEYVGKEGEPKSRPSWQSGQSAAGPAESSETMIGRFVAETAQAIGRSYSHYWPAPDASSRDLLLHLSHVLLSQDFSVFAKVAHPRHPESIVDLLGITPGQDFFLACQFQHIGPSPPWNALFEDIARLETFWLHPGLTIDACRQHIVRVAEHCQRGYALLCALHGVTPLAGGDRLLELWHGRSGDEERSKQFAAKLTSLGAEWIQPRLMRRFDDEVAYYLLAALFPIAKPSV